PRQATEQARDVGDRGGDGADVLHPLQGGEGARQPRVDGEEIDLEARNGAELLEESSSLDGLATEDVERRADEEDADGGRGGGRCRSIVSGGHAPIAVASRAN